MKNGLRPGVRFILAIAVLYLVLSCSKADNGVSSRVGTENTFAVVLPGGGAAALAKAAVRNADFRPAGLPYIGAREEVFLEADSLGVVSFYRESDDSLLVEILSADAGNGVWLKGTPDEIGEDTVSLALTGSVIINWLTEVPYSGSIAVGFPGTPYYSRVLNPDIDSLKYFPVSQGIHTLEILLLNGDEIIDRAYVDSLWTNYSEPGRTELIRLFSDDIIAAMLAKPGPCRFELNDNVLKQDSLDNPIFH